MFIKNRLVRIYIQHSFPLILAVLVLGIGTIAITSHSITVDSERQAVKQLRGIETYYETILEQMDSLNLMFTTNTEMVSHLRQLLSTEDYSLQDYRDMRLIRSFLSASSNASPYVDSIYVFFDNASHKVLTSNDSLVSLSEMSDRGWYDTFSENRKNPSETYVRQVTLEPEGAGKKHVLRIFRTIMDSSGKPTGVIVLNLLKDPIANDLADKFLETGKLLYIRDQNGTLLFTIPDKNVDFTNPDFQYFTHVSQRYGWVYTLIASRKDLYHVVDTLRLFTIILAFVAALLGLFLTLKTNKKERVFISNVLRQLEKAGEHDLENDPIKSEENIFDYLNHSVIKAFLDQEYFRVKTEALEYRTLQMQINPHFLFNTLDTIYWKAIKLDGENDISKMIVLLSKILKYSLNLHDKDGVSLDDEISITQYYLQLQRYRFRRRFEVRWDVDPDLSAFHVPGLLFQPILENAFNHGFREDSVLHIVISLQKNEGDVIFVVSNDGKKINLETLAQLNSSGEDVSGKSVSIGLSNVKKRVEMFYHGKAVMMVDAPPDLGMRITITIAA